MDYSHDDLIRALKKSTYEELEVEITKFQNAYNRVDLKNIGNYAAALTAICQNHGWDYAEFTDVHSDIFIKKLKELTKKK